MDPIKISIYNLTQDMDPIKISIYNLTQDLDSNYLDSDPDPT